jgi:hypothetical protein
MPVLMGTASTLRLTGDGALTDVVMKDDVVDLGLAEEGVPPVGST